MTFFFFIWTKASVRWIISRLHFEIRIFVWYFVSNKSDLKCQNGSLVFVMAIFRRKGHDLFKMNKHNRDPRIPLFDS